MHYWYVGVNNPLAITSFFYITPKNNNAIVHLPLQLFVLLPGTVQTMQGRIFVSILAVYIIILKEVPGQQVRLLIMIT